MTNRITIILPDEIVTQLHVIQGKAIVKYDGNISFSDVISIGMAHALAKGYNTQKLLEGKEAKRR